MPYTLMKGWGWVLLGVLLGIFIGWLLRSIAAKRQVARARNHHVDSVELERLRGRVANLEPVAAERDRLQAELDQCRSQAAAPSGESDARESTAAADAQLGAVDSGVEGPADVAVPSGAIPSAPAAPDMSQAHAVLGTSITLDDLKVVEGIGPKIESLCHGIGIRTWFDLSTTEVSLLRTMLADAGSRFRRHDPSTWPEQAGLLAAGRWDDFKALTDGLRSGRPAG
jgi:predicted flap endonuclease-1-like 5' DNA nuclease